MVEVIIVSSILALVLFKINHPEVRWGCLVGKHKYSYLGSKSGMHYNKDTKQVTGTMRRLYQCSCGKDKPAESKDWINT